VNRGEAPGVLELASVDTIPQPPSPAKKEIEATYAIAADSQSITDIYVSSDDKPDSPIVTELVQQAQENIISWAEKEGLVEGRERDKAESPQQDNVTDESPEDPTNPGGKSGDATNDVNSGRNGGRLAFVSDALTLYGEGSLGSDLLQTLVLGGGALYAFERFSGGKVTEWVRQLLAKAPGSQASVISHERVITVFLMESERGLKRIVAAKVTDEKIEILAEQILPMSLSAAAAPDQADLERELKNLVKKVTDQTNATHDLLLFDPKLKEDLPIYDSLGKDNNELQPKKLESVFSTLNAEQLADLRKWINKPSRSDLNDHPISDQLRQRQKQLRSLVNHDKACLLSMLELSLAMAQRRF